MTNYEKIKSFTQEELIEWLDHLAYSNQPIWNDWFQHKYCDKCEGVKKWSSYLEREAEEAYCEDCGKCRYFPDIEGTLNTKQTISLWLQENAE